MLLTNHKTMPVDLPDDLLDAQESGSLVIFAGAGISKSPPSNLPLFIELAKELCDLYNTDFEEIYSDKIDVFLGKLEDKHNNLHVDAQQVFINKYPKPNILHNSIVRLFNNKQQLKIITTNYDDLLTKAAENYFESEIVKYYAPALPLGSDFSGIVYLHGNVQDTPNKMVLTDRDFGKAYMTEGWARRFLQEVFQKYSVLFVGYSHKDMLMQYFSRGLAVNVKPRFAFACTDEYESWHSLKIAPIVFPPSKKKNKYKYLHDAIQNWANITELNFFEHERKLNEIINIGPKAEDQSLSYLERALGKNYFLKHFTNLATDIAWFKWARDKGYLTCLFRLDTNVDPNRIVILADWFVNNVLANHSDFGFETFIKYNYKMTSILFNLLHSFLFGNSDKLDSLLYNKWINILRFVALKSNSQYWGLSQLLLKSEPTAELSKSIILIDLLTTSIIMPVKKFGLEGEIIEWQPKLLDEMNGIDSFVKNVEKNIDLYAEYFCSIISNNLMLVYELMVSVGNTWDSISFHRSAIASHEQDRFREEYDPIIDLLRLCILSLLKNKNQIAKYYIENWSSSKIILLKRFSIYAQAMNEGKKANFRLNWLIKKDFLFAFGLKTEAFFLIKKCYKKLSLNEQNKFALKVIDKFSLKRSEDKDLYELYNILIWLKDISNTSDVVKEKLTTIQLANPKWQPREHPDLDFYISTSVAEYKSPVSVDELLSKKPKEWIELLLTYEGGDTFHEPDKYGLFEILAGACSKNSKWAIELLEFLDDILLIECDLVSAIYQGLKDAKLDAILWERLFDIIINMPDFASKQYYLAWLMNEGMEDDHKKIPYNLLTKAEKVSDIIWDTKDTDDWSDFSISGALNHFGGKTALFWLYALSDRRQMEKFSEIPKSYKDRFSRIINGDSKKEFYALMYLGSQLPFLLSIDRTWTSENIVPMFDFSLNENKATYIWEGFLLLCRFHPQIVQNLLPYYPSAITNIEDDSDMRHKLLEHIAFIMLYCDKKNHEDRTIIDLIGKVDSDKEKATIVGVLDREISRLDDKSKENLWKSRIKKYWQNRSNNVPNQLQDKEKLELIKLSLKFNTVFNECYEIIRRHNSIEIDDYLLYQLRKDSSNNIYYPSSFASFLIHILNMPSTNIPRYFCDDLNKIGINLHENECDNQLLKKYCIAIMENGCDLDSYLRELIE